MLVVPLLLKDDATGVLSVANRRDGQAFSHDDQELITALSRQAAVAIENVRRYTSTDQTLAERVEELSVMQRIDRELNTSLDVHLSMRLTLEWAMRQSKASAGLIGMIRENGLSVIASEGYQQELEHFTEGIIPETYTPIQRAYQAGQPQYDQLDPQSSQSILEDARAQSVIPIRRENEVIGILLLEYTQPDKNTEEATEFLVRLCDHAAIAIANARLYSEVQAANQAKNDFISFVSHELKTPMTSIRGYTDLLTSGIVGSINENQANFLSTIRSNVDRMATLVSDLTDVSRIEAGRVRLDFESVPASDVVSEVSRSISTQIEEKEQTLEITIPENLPPMWGDRTRLVQILTNLITNAHKYSPARGKITVTAEETMQATAQGTSRAIHLVVQDNGYGISTENQKNIFQKFYRSDDPNIRDTPGTGLGLNISKQLIEMLGGQIWFESEYRSGSSFHITVPIAGIKST
jgi:signal transduction histidine kinase